MGLTNNDGIVARQESISLPPSRSMPLAPKQIPVAAHQARAPSVSNSKCAGTPDYAIWLDQLFALAPTTPPCGAAHNLTQQLKQRLGEPQQRSIVLLRRQRRRHANGWGIVHTGEMLWSATSATKTSNMSWRVRSVIDLWEEASRSRRLPDDVEMVVATNDKPREARLAHLPAPVFSWCTEVAGVGSGPPLQWKGQVPFPSAYLRRGAGSALHNMSCKNTSDECSCFLKYRKPIIYYRGNGAEREWGASFPVDLAASSYPTSRAYQETARFKLAKAGSEPSDRDVLDVALTGFPRVHTRTWKNVREVLMRKHNITVATQAPMTAAPPARMALSVASNGWAAATTLFALNSGAAMLAILDETVDSGGFPRNMGESYFPMLQAHKHFVPVDYETLASAARVLNAHPQRTFALAQAGRAFAKRFLGNECALDLVELLAWRYVRYLKRGCLQSAVSAGE